MKQSDVDSISTFEEEVEALRSLLLRSKVPVESEAMTAALDWLSRTTSPEKRERWVSGINSFSVFYHLYSLEGSAQPLLQAARFTWREFLMNMQSTQRAEAVHSAISGFLTKSTLLVDLLRALDNYNFDVARRAETKKFKNVQALEEVAKNGGSQYLVTLVRPRPPSSPAHKNLKLLRVQALKHVGPYGMKLFQAQLVESTYYDVVPGAEPNVFVITRKGAAACDEVPPGDDGSAAAEEAEVGLVASSLNIDQKPRRTTLYKCSCQFPRFAGVPCRHQLALICRTGAVKSPEDLAKLNLFNKRWLEPGTEELLKSKVELLSRLPALRRAAPGGSSGLSRDDRFGLLVGSFKAVADVCSGSQTLYEQAMGAVSTMLADVMRGNPPRGRGALGGGGAGVGGARGMVPKPCRAGTADRLQPARGGTSSNDRCNGCWELGHRKNSKQCRLWDPVKNVFHPPLPKPRKARAAATAVRQDTGAGWLIQGSTLGAQAAEGGGADGEMAAGEASNGGEDETLAAGERHAEQQRGSDEREEEKEDTFCYICHYQIDTAAGEAEPVRCGDVYCIGRPRKVFHLECLDEAAVQRLEKDKSSGDAWQCPWCFDAAFPKPVANPKRRPPGRGGNNRQKRHRGASEPSKTQRRDQRQQAAGRKAMAAAGGAGGTAAGQ